MLTLVDFLKLHYKVSDKLKWRCKNENFHSICYTLAVQFFFHSQWFLFDDVPDFCAFLLACHRGTFCLTVAIAMFPRCCLSLGAAAAEGAWLGHDGISGNLYMHATGRQDGGMGMGMGTGGLGVKLSTRAGQS